MTDELVTVIANQLIGTRLHFGNETSDTAAIPAGKYFQRGDTLIEAIEEDGKFVPSSKNSFKVVSLPSNAAKRAVMVTQQPIDGKFRVECDYSQRWKTTIRVIGEKSTYALTMSGHWLQEKAKLLWEKDPWRFKPEVPLNAKGVPDTGGDKDQESSAKEERKEVSKHHAKARA